MPEVASRNSGPEALLRLKASYLVPCTYHFYREPPQIVAASGSTLFDHAGNRYLDCCSGVTVMNAGHGNPRIVEPAIDQIRTLQHTTSIYLTEPVLRLAERLAEIAPGSLRRSFFCASGSEAVEGAMMLATLHTGRPDVIAMDGGLHGRTRWAMNATGLAMWRTDPFPAPDVHHVPFGDAEELRRVLEVHGSRTAAVIAEPVLGNGGVVVPPDDYWPQVRRLCDEHGVLLILDEVQTGMNRTGRWFACEHWDVQPDILTTSKALGNGFPIAAYVATDEIAASWTRPSASTYGGNPVCATAALATIDYHTEFGLGELATHRGGQLRYGLREVASRHPAILAQPRGLGLMLGVAVLGDDGGPSAVRCDDLLEALKDRGVLAAKTGPDRNVLTFLPPLVIMEDEIGDIIDALDASIDSLP